jgi:hypothetical protein
MTRLRTGCPWVPGVRLAMSLHVHFSHVQTRFTFRYARHSRMLVSSGTRVMPVSLDAAFSDSLYS